MTWFSGGLCSAGVTVGRDELDGFSNLVDSVVFMFFSSVIKYLLYADVTCFLLLLLLTLPTVLFKALLGRAGGKVPTGNNHLIAYLILSYSARS